MHVCVSIVTGSVLKVLEWQELTAQIFFMCFRKCQLNVGLSLINQSVGMNQLLTKPEENQSPSHLIKTHLT